MRTLRDLLVILALAAAASAADRADLADLARAGQWSKILTEVADRDPGAELDPQVALLMAYAARGEGMGDIERAAWTAAVGDDPTGQVARAELSALMLADDAVAAAELVLPMLTSAASRPLRERAVEVLERALASDPMPELEARLDGVLRRVDRSSRRRIEAVLAARGGEQARGRALALLQQSTGDLPALAAAHRIERETDPTARERWLAAKALFRHGHYQRAAVWFDALAKTRDTGIPVWEVRFLRGRCGFRLGRWSEAAAWYRRAVKLAPDRETAADLEIHLARALELQGDLEQAIEAARRAVVTRASDDRRIALARLRLANDQRDRAEAGLSRLTGRESRDRAAIVLALDALRRGDEPRALARLAEVRRTRIWRGPAAVLAAELDGDAGRWSACARRLEAAAHELDAFWGEAARRLVVGMPAAVRDPWLAEIAARGGAATDPRDRTLATWSVLEVDADRLAAARRRVAELTGLSDPAPRSGLGAVAKALWESGLEAQAVAWAPEQFPDRDGPSAAWSALELRRYGAVRAAISVADTARWRSAPGLPERVLPEPLRRALFPLPFRFEVGSAASAAGVPWTLLAAVVRAESSWEPAALSAVGARGLTQLMPATAETAARRAGVPVPRQQDLFHPELSLELGATELGRLLERFGGRADAAVSAYNAGESQAARWLEGCGPACLPSRFVLGVSFDVTRGYTTAVLAAESAYRELWGSDPHPVGLTDRSASPREPPSPPRSTVPARR